MEEVVVLRDEKSELFPPALLTRPSTVNQPLSSIALLSDNGDLISSIFHPKSAVTTIQLCTMAFETMRKKYSLDFWTDDGLFAHCAIAVEGNTNCEIDQKLDIIC